MIDSPYPNDRDDDRFVSYIMLADNPRAQLSQMSPQDIRLVAWLDGSMSKMCGLSGLPRHSVCPKASHGTLWDAAASATMTLKAHARVSTVSMTPSRSRHSTLITVTEIKRKRRLDGHRMADKQHSIFIT